jgi:hypothetical protein
VINKSTPIIWLSIVLSALLFFQAHGYAQTMDDSFSSDSGMSSGGLSDTDMTDLFGEDAVTGFQKNNDAINLRAEVFVRSLPNNLHSLYGILDQLLRGKLTSWHYPNISKLSLWINYCRAVLGKAEGLCYQNGGLDTFNSNPGKQLSDARTDRITCWRAWSAAYNAILTLSPHNRNEEQEPHRTQTRAEAQKAIELAETLCNFHKTPRGLAAPPEQQLPTSDHNTMPPAAPPRGTIWTAPEPSKLVFRGKNVSTAHYERVKNAVDKLPANVQQFLINHKVKIMAVDTIETEHPELKGEHPPGHSDKQTWDNLDAIYLSSTNEVDVAARVFNSTWKPTSRIEAVLFHELGHIIDHHSNNFSQNDKTYVDDYNKENFALSKIDRKQLKYFIYPLNRNGSYEMFSELFALTYGSAPSGTENQKLLEDKFRETLNVVKNMAHSLH